MHTSRGMPAVRVIARPVAQFFGICAGSAMAFAALAWMFLPYERLERFTPEARFLAWEGVVWMFALLLGFLGLTCVLQVVGGQMREGVRELLQHLSGEDTNNPVEVVAAVLPWWMIACGSFLALIGVLARATIAP